MLEGSHASFKHPHILPLCLLLMGSLPRSREHFVSLMTYPYPKVDCLMSNKRNETRINFAKECPQSYRTGNAWCKVASDLYQLNGWHFLVLVDYYSNLTEVEDLQSLTSKFVIQHMKRIIARHGIMDTLITDNEPQNKIQEFAEFTKLYGIQHLTSSPLQPQSNGLAAEKAVQTIKQMMIKCMETNSDF